MTLESPNKPNLSIVVTKLTYWFRIPFCKLEFQRMYRSSGLFPDALVPNLVIKHPTLSESTKCTKDGVAIR